MKRLFAVLLCAVFVISLAACSKSADTAENAAQDIYYSTSDGKNYDEIGSAESTADSAASGEVTQNEKIIKTVELYVQTKEYDAYVSALTASVASAGGYIENSTADLGGYSDYNRSATYIVRIPADKLGEFLTAADENGKITSKTENQQNVTLEYVDLESRIEAYKTEKETLSGLLEKADSLESILAIQERLSEVNYQIESYTSQLKVLENRVSYSTVTLNISEVERVTEEETTLWTRIKNRFLNNIDNLVDNIQDFIVDFIGGLPIIIPTAAVIAVIVLILRKIIKKRKSSR